MIGLIIASLTSMVTQNCVFNKVCKKNLKNSIQIDSYNVIPYTVCSIVFGVMLLGGKISLFTVLLGLVFGIVTAIGTFYRLMALTVGPMHVTLLITTSSMIIPALSGVFFGEGFSFPKLIAIFVLLFFIYLSLEKSGGKRVNLRWFLYCLLAFLNQGLVGVLQKIHQSSPHKQEVAGFLFVSFLCAVLFCFVRTRGSLDKSVYNGKNMMLGVICGACIFGANFINLQLSGMLPSQLFFPLINGSSIVITSLISVIFFKERLSKRQTVGLIGGILSLIAICFIN